MDARPLAAEDTVSPHRSNSSSDSRRPDAGAVAWRSLLHPRVLIATALITLFLALAGYLLPQLPDQLRDEPAAAARWLLSAASAHDAIGPVLRSLGLFDVVHSLLFRLALVTLSLIAALRLADSLGRAEVYIRLKKRFCSAPVNVGEPIRLAINLPILRRRLTVDSVPESVQGRVVAWMADHFDSVTRCGTAAPHAPDERATSADAPAPTNESSEHRILGIRNGSSFLLQPLPPLGLLCILAVLWLFLLVGWEMRSPTLPPGGSYRAPSRDLLIRYNAPDTTDQGQNTATVTIELDQRTITATATSDFRIRSGVADIRGRLTDPGLFARVTDGRALLTNPGQPEQVAGVGVVLPSPGSEESLLLPDMSIGLRIVRRTDVPAAFVVEVYQGAERRPKQRIDVGGPIRTVVGANPETVELELLPLSGVEVTVRHMPGQWLLWIALAAFIVGVAGYVRPPAFGALQIGPWQNSRSVIVIQTNRHDILETIEGTMDIAEAPVPSDPADSPNELEASSIA